MCCPALPSAKTYDELCKCLDEYYTPPSTVYKERKAFYGASRESGETAMEWLAKIKSLALNCEFGTSIESILLDKFITGLEGKSFNRVCEEDSKTLTLTKAASIATKYDDVSKIAHVDFIKNKSKKNVPNRFEKSSTQSRGKCAHCGYRNHSSEACKYRKSVCHKCDKPGHIASVCKQKKRSDVNYVMEEDRQTVASFSANSMNGVFNVVCANTTNNEMMADISIGGERYKFMIDSGSSVSLINVKHHEKFFAKYRLKKTDIHLFAYSGHNIKVIGEFCPMVRYGTRESKLNILVVDGKGPSILGRDFLSKFHLTFAQVNNINTSTKSSLDQLLHKFGVLFSGELGKYTQNKVKLELNPECTSRPIFCKPRTVPYAFREQVNAELDRLEQLGVISPVSTNEWGTPLVPVLKEDGSIRICADYKITVNKCLVDDRQPLPRVDDIFNALQGGTAFTKLDLNMAYNQLELDEPSEKIAAWSTTRGVYLVHRLPFGVKTATGIFQRTMERLFQGLSGVFVFVDDIIVTGKTERDHINNLGKVFQRLVDVGLRLRKDKCLFFQDSVKYLGHIVNREGLSKSNERVEAIMNAPRPKDVSEVRSFCGLINYYGRYIRNLAQRMHPLYQLLKEEAKFNWNAECERAFEEVKAEVAKEVTLAHFNPKLPIILETDASEKGIGGVLSHRLPNGDERPIAFTSRTLSKAESNYPVIQKEALAIIEATKKFHDYIIGHPLTLRTDHKPLLGIFGDKKGIPGLAAARMQRWAIHLSAFNYKIEHKKGVENCVADALSRLPLPGESSSVDEGKTYVHFIEERGVKLNHNVIRHETSTDVILAKVYTAVLDGSVKNLVGPTYQPYRQRGDELTIESGVLMWGYRVVIPPKCQQKVMESIHASHMGIVKSKSIARSYVWWPGIDDDLEKFIKGCEACATVRPSPPKTELKPWENTGKAWSRLHIDYAGPINGNHFLIIMDSFSKWIEIFQTKTTTSDFTIGKLMHVFARFGLPDVIVSDAGTQFTSDVFKQFMSSNGIKAIVTPPGHPASNGAAENAVKTFKKTFRAALIFAKKNNRSCDLNVIIQRYMMDYRTTIHCTTGQTPAKLLLGRELKTRMNLLRPPSATETITNNQSRQIQNSSGRRREHFTLGDIVMIRDYHDPNHPSWEKATVCRVLGDKTYLCERGNGKVIKRHIDQMTKFYEKSETDEKSKFANDFNSKSVEKCKLKSCDKVNEKSIKSAVVMKRLYKPDVIVNVSPNNDQNNIDENVNRNQNISGENVSNQSDVICKQMNLKGVVIKTKQISRHNIEID